MLDVCERYQVFGAELRSHAELAVGREGNVEDSGYVVERFALDDFLPFRIDNGDFRLGRSSVRSKFGIDMGAIQQLAVGRQGEITGTAPSQQTLDFLPALKIDYGDIVAEAVGDVERFAGAVGNYTVGLETRGEGLHNLERASVEDGHGVVP